MSNGFGLPLPAPGAPLGEWADKFTRDLFVDHCRRRAFEAGRPDPYPGEPRLWRPPASADERALAEEREIERRYTGQSVNAGSRGRARLSRPYSSR